ncbi:alpha-hydroxy-acid oxidizing protein [Acidaminococcus sp.]|uniref:alpha-hydroxy-acid oxidizing protein n=1 Tax=Acidaminococcus sp. TaxID=1872103 RepID=UPI003D7D77DD
MDYKEMVENARKCLGKCKGCPICNGVACRNMVPGPGAKGVGDTAIRNYNKWQEIRVVMDTLCAKRPVDTSLELFGKTFKYPIFAGPVGAVAMHYSDKYNDVTYNAELVPGAAEAGIAAFTGDGMDPQVMKGATDAIKACGGLGVPTVKPWNTQMISEKMEQVKASNAFAVAMDVDAAGLPFLKNFVPPAGSKSVDEMKEIIKMAGRPFIIKGIMSVKGALKAKEAGASAIVVSNHGGRVLDQSPATAEVLEEIAVAVGDSMKIFVDGGIRSGVDVFKALAMGADAVLIARPFVNAVYGGGKEGVKILADKLGAELADTMEMCGAASLKEITAEMIRK